MSDQAMSDQTPTDNTDQVTYWNEVAGDKWVANQTRLDRLMAPLTEPLVAGAAPKPGERVLDVGCGCGDLALRAAAAVGPTGRVEAVDISRPMLAHAEERSQAIPVASRAPIEWLLGDAMVHGFAPTADLMVSRFGVMFFADRPRAFANLHGALKPGGRFAFLTWRRRSHCEWMQLPLEWVAPVLPTPEDVPGEIGPFGLADEGATQATFEAAGFHDVTVEPVDRSVLIGATADEAFDLLLDAGPLARLLRDAEPEPRQRAVQVLREALARRDTGAGITLGAACWLYRGRA